MQGIAGCGLPAGTSGQLQRLSPPLASAASIAAITRSVIAPVAPRKRGDGVWDDFAGAKDVPLNRVEDLRAGHASLDVLRDVAVRQAGVAGAASGEIEDAELPALKRRILR